MNISQTLKRVIVMLLAVAMVFSVSCGGSEGNTSGGQGGDANNAFDQVTDLGGYEFTAASSFIMNEMPESATVAEQIFEQVRREIEKEYNCTITINDFELTSGTIDTFKAKIQTGDKVADMIDVFAQGLIPAQRLGLLKNFDEIEGINPSDERWVDTCTNVGTYANGHYALQFMRPTEVRNCLVYNRALVKKMYGDVNLADLVRKNEWTFDKFLEILKACTSTTMVDGKPEVYGLASSTRVWFGYAMVAANNARLLTVDQDGYATETLDNENTVYALNFLSDLCQKEKVMTYQGFGNEEGACKAFLAGDFAFMHCESWVINQRLKPIAGDFDYGMLPLPMGPNAKEYYSSCDNMRMWCVSANNPDLDKVAYVLNAFGRKTYNYGEHGEKGNWWDDITMSDYFQEGDTDSLEMYNLTLKGSVMDYGAMVGGISSAFQEKILEKCVFSKNARNVSAQIKSLHGTFDQDISDIFNMK